MNAQPFEIVVAEDNPADLALVREALRVHEIECGLRVMRDGEKALEFLDGLDRDPNMPRMDLLILDMHLPKHDGEDILKRLRSTEHYAQTPVIVMTSRNLTNVEATAATHAVLYYFPKPSTLDEFMKLGTIVREALGQRNGSQRETTGRKR